MPETSRASTSGACSATTRRSSLTFVFVGALRRDGHRQPRRSPGTRSLTPKQLSTTFLYAAVLGLIAAGQTLVMLTGGVDLSVATTATAAAFTVSRVGTHGAAEAIAVALARRAC